MSTLTKPTQGNSAALLYNNAHSKGTNNTLLLIFIPADEPEPTISAAESTPEKPKAISTPPASPAHESIITQTDKHGTPKKVEQTQQVLLLLIFVSSGLFITYSYNIFYSRRRPCPSPVARPPGISAFSTVASGETARTVRAGRRLR